MLKHFITTIDYKKLIEMQASRETPFVGPINICKNTGKVNNSPAKVKKNYKIPKRIGGNYV